MQMYPVVSASTDRGVRNRQGKIQRRNTELDLSSRELTGIRSVLQ
jgi:hypothetical protein